jgi:hypothetical protein
MGRNKDQGTKNLIHVIRHSRSQWIELSNGASHSKITVSMRTYNRIVSELERRGVKFV